MNSFNIDDSVSFVFNVGGMVPLKPADNKPVKAVIKASLAGEPVIGNITVIEEE